MNFLNSSMLKYQLSHLPNYIDSTKRVYVPEQIGISRSYTASAVPLPLYFSAFRQLSETKNHSLYGWKKRSYKKITEPNTIKVLRFIVTKER